MELLNPSATVNSPLLHPHRVERDYAAGGQSHCDGVEHAEPKIVCSIGGRAIVIQATLISEERRALGVRGDEAGVEGGEQQP